MLRVIVQERVRSFVKAQSLRTGLRCRDRIGNYSIGDLEEHAGQIPLNQLLPILGQLSKPEDLMRWWIDLQVELYGLKKSLQF
jgi:hypothetical protein